MITKPELFSMMSQKSALSLELKGMKHSRGSVYAMIKRKYHLTGNKERVYTQFCELVEKAKGEVKL